MSQRSRIGKRELPRAPAAVACRGKELLASAYGFRFLKRTRLCLRAWLPANVVARRVWQREGLGSRFPATGSLRGHALAQLRRQFLFQKNRRSTPDQDRSVPGSRDRNRHRQICRWPPDGVLPRASPRSPARESSGSRRQMPLDREVLPVPASLLRPSERSDAPSGAPRPHAVRSTWPPRHSAVQSRQRHERPRWGRASVAINHRPFRRRSVPPLDRSPQSRSAV